VATVGNLILDLGLDPSQFYSDMNRVKTDAVKQSRELERLITPDISGVNKKLRLTPTVDFSQIHKLNDLFDIKVKHAKKVQGYFNSSPLTVHINTKALDRAAEQIKMLHIAANKPISVTTSTTNTVKTVYKNVQDSSSFGSDRSTQNKNGNSKQLLNVSSNTSKINDNLEKLIDIQNKATGFSGAIKQGIGQQLGGVVAARTQKVLKRNINLDAGGFTEKLANVATLPIKRLVIDNPAIAEFSNAIGKKVEDRLTKASYKLGDGIVAALDTKGDASSKLQSFVDSSINLDELKKGAKELREEFKEIGKELKSAFISPKVFQQELEAFDNFLTNRKKKGIQERAIPLVRQRANEIAASKKTNNTGNVVDDDTQQLIIATGGYAKARGLSGKRLASDINKQNIEGSKAIWVRNTDTDIEKSEGAGGKAGQLMKSLAKPNLRGYSLDALEMAAQALAAIEKNPNVTIKFLGESGGGFAAEEAATMLQMMGVENVEYLGLGTPDFIGGTDKSGKNKVISPDEYLGRESEILYQKLGLSNKTSSQSILGAADHPYEGYRDVGMAELRNFIEGAPAQFSEDETAQIKEASDAYKNIDLSKLDSRQVADIAKQSFQNLQEVRRRLLVATGDTKDELQKIADTFESVYVAAAPESAQFGQIRGVIA